MILIALNESLDETVHSIRDLTEFRLLKTATPLVAMILMVINKTDTFFLGRCCFFLIYYMSNLKNVVWLQCICSISKSVGSLFGLISFDFQIKRKRIR